ncbi:MAG TPA: hypothetical protein VHB99_18935, partial [Pirellulales bacterium]|nr:hypothetical protein [Pirellulales bacterium]
MVGCLQLALKEQFMFLRFQYGDALEQYFGPTTEESVVQTHLLAERARQIGLIVSDDAVNEFLRSLTQDKVPREGFKSLVKELNATQAQVFSALRTELAAQRLREMSLPGGETTPAQRWDYYRRMKQRAVVEAAPVSVAQFVEEVADPSQDELAKFFDEHKEQEPQQLSPTPGFKVPKQAAFQYFVAEYDKFYDESAVTQEEIEKYYEANKDLKYLYSAFDFPETEEPAAKEPEGKQAPSKAKHEGGKQEEGKPAGETKKDEDAKADDQSSTLSAASNVAVAALGSRPSQAFAGLLQSALLADGDGDEEKTPAAEDKSEGAAKSDAGAEKPAEEKPAAEAAEKSEDSEKAKAEPSAAAKKPTADLAPPISNDLLLIRDIREGEKPKYAPLWKVEGDIRKTLAGEKAVERMNKAFGVIQAKMSRFNRNLDPDETNPKLPDLTSAAESQQLIERTTELQTALAFKEDHPALADATPDQQSLGERPLPLIDLGYGAMIPYRNVIVKDLAGNRYLVWKIEEKDAYVPELNDV